MSLISFLQPISFLSATATPLTDASLSSQAVPSLASSQSDFILPVPTESETTTVTVTVTVTGTVTGPDSGCIPSFTTIAVNTVTVVPQSEEVTPATGQSSSFAVPQSISVVPDATSTWSDAASSITATAPDPAEAQSNLSTSSYVTAAALTTAGAALNTSVLSASWATPALPFFPNSTTARTESSADNNLTTNALASIPSTSNSSAPTALASAAGLGPEIATPTSVAGATETHWVDVGARGELLFSPQTLDAAVGDVVMFQFLAFNHTVTQSSFDAPCTSQNGFDSGFRFFNPLNQTGIVNQRLSFLVRDSEPVWFFCRQTKPRSHCNAGMVFAINAGDQWTAFLSNAELDVATSIPTLSLPTSSFGASPTLVSPGSLNTSTEAVKQTTVVNAANGSFVSLAVVSQSTVDAFYLIFCFLISIVLLLI